MFLCRPCHGPEPCLGEIVQSRGKCERCGEIANCIDCHVGTHRKISDDAEGKDAAMKCIVKHCPNTSDQGRFEGTLCAPCAGALRGEGRSSQYAATRILTSIWPYPGLDRGRFD